MLCPSMILFGNRSTFYVRLDNHDILRCSIDRSAVTDYRNDYEGFNKKDFKEVEISIYPRISEAISKDIRVLDLIYYLVDSLTSKFDKKVIYDIKYQRGAKLLGLSKV